MINSTIIKIEIFFENKYFRPCYKINKKLKVKMTSYFT